MQICLWKMRSGWSLCKKIMSENPIRITNINDFIFCPMSIYFHGLDVGTETMLYQCEDQLMGTAAHEKSDKQQYSDKKNILQAIDVYSEKYGLIGKIDVFDLSTGLLTERKNKVSEIYDGYVFQLYAQFFALVEMGYAVKKLRIYSMRDNKTYNIKLPSEDEVMLKKFEQTIKQMKEFDMTEYRQENSKKCERCIYEPMCSYQKEVK